MAMKPERFCVWMAIILDTWSSGNVRLGSGRPPQHLTLRATNVGANVLDDQSS
jgi:hypothetical protein